MYGALVAKVIRRTLVHAQGANGLPQNVTLASLRLLHDDTTKFSMQEPLSLQECEFAVDEFAVVS